MEADKLTSDPYPPEGTADFLGNDYAPQIVNASYNSCCFHYFIVGGGLLGFVQWILVRFPGRMLSVAL